MDCSPTVHDHARADADPLAPARQHFARLCAVLAEHGVRPAPDLELHSVPGPISHYDFARRHIYIGTYRHDDAAAQLMMRYLGSILGLDDQPVRELFDLLLPWSLAHEYAHHLRHHEGLFGADRGREEMIAHRLAGCFCQDVCTGDRHRLSCLLRHALECLGGRLRLPRDVYVDTYADLPLALGGVGRLRMRTARAIQAIGRRHPRTAARLLMRTGEGSTEIGQRLRRRNEWQRAFNDNRCGPEQILYLHLGWTALALTVEERGYMEQWVRTCLGRVGSTAVAPMVAPMLEQAERADIRSTAWTVLARTDPFRQFPPAWRLELSHCALRLHAGAGELLADARERSDDVFLVDSGCIAIEGNPANSALGRHLGAAWGACGQPISIRARTAVSGHILRGLDLRVFGLRHPGAVPVLRQWSASVDTAQTLMSYAYGPRTRFSAVVSRLFSPPG
jgi:hypothetical protein